jgi:hypothetical protein
MDKRNMKVSKDTYEAGKASVEDYLTLLYYRLTGREETHLVPLNDETEKQADEYYREFCLGFENIYGKEFLVRMKDRISRDDEELEKIEEALLNDEAGFNLYEFASSEKAISDSSIVANIRTSYEYGMEFLHAFNITHNIIPDDYTVIDITRAIINEENYELIAEDKIPVLAASDSFFTENPNYVWDGRKVPGFSEIESSLFRKGKDDYCFILHVKKGSCALRRVKIIIRNPGEEETILMVDCPEKEGNVILNYKGHIDQKSIIELKVNKVS